MPVPLLALAGFLAAWARARADAPPAVVFEQVRIFDGVAERLSPPSQVLIVGNRIQTIATAPIPDPLGTPTLRVKGDGRTLMPGLIDAHTHLMFATVPPSALGSGDVVYLGVAATRAAEEMLLRGFTSVRDLGGPVFGLKRGIDEGRVPGPRIWPAGATLSQTGGHGDFRPPNGWPAAPELLGAFERLGLAAIADGADSVRRRAREQLALGAAQLGVMGSGGMATNHDPLDVTQFTLPELRAAVEAAESWGTYVAVRAHTPEAVRQAIEAGARCIEHGQLLDEATVKLMAEQGLWWSLQPLGEDRLAAFPEGSPHRLELQRLLQGTDTAYRLARKYRVRTAWGTDVRFDAEAAATQGGQLVRLARWYTPAEVLRMATADNAELLALAGPRSPYAGRLGRVREGALADLLLVDGDPLSDLSLLADPARRLLVIMKDGRIHKNSLPE